jgi:hypothetical protein
MKPSRLNRAAYTACAVLILTGLLGSFGGYLDSLDQVDEWAASQMLVDAQLSEARETRKERAAREMCLQTVGESTAVWTVDGDVVCQPRKSKGQL